jgi:hypothetical protein
MLIARLLFPVPPFRLVNLASALLLAMALVVPLLPLVLGRDVLIRPALLPMVLHSEPGRALLLIYPLILLLALRLASGRELLFLLPLLSLFPLLLLLRVRHLEQGRVFLTFLIQVLIWTLSSRSSLPLWPTVHPVLLLLVLAATLTVPLKAFLVILQVAHLLLCNCLCML